MQRGGREYRQLLERIKRRICNKSKQGVCCPEPKKEEKCKGGHPCLKENQCEYAQDLRIKLKNGDNNAKQELIGLICDRQDRTFCCPPTPATGSGTPSQQKTNDQITNDEKGPSWLPGKGKCGLSGEHASTIYLSIISNNQYNDNMGNRNIRQDEAATHSSYEHPSTVEQESAVQ